jgi:dipeptidase D
MSTNRILSGFEPASVLSFFEDICAIPHVSGSEQAIADYIEQFAKTRGLSCYRDHVHNVFIKLPASAGHESAPAVML